MSLYPVLHLNYKLRCADSFSLDSLTLNIVGYMCYSYAIASQMFSQTVRAQYQLQFEGSLPLLSWADMFYTFHGLALQLLLLSQVILGPHLWGFSTERRSLHISGGTKVILVGLATFLIFQYYNNDDFRELNLVLNLSTVKLVISLIKYIPQVLLNMRRKSMYGLSRLQTGFDAAGAVFCLTELILKNKLPLLEAIDSNRGKVGITLVTLLFSAIFSLQFYLYTSESPERKKHDDMEKGLSQ